MSVSGQVSQQSHIGKGQDQAHHYKATNLEDERAAGKQVNGEAGEKGEQQSCDSVSRLSQNSLDKKGEQKNRHLKGKKLEHIT